MLTSSEIRAARKEKQLARLELKGDESYSDFYCNQPLQILLAEKNVQIKDAQSALKKASHAYDLAKVTGDDVAAAKDAVFQATTDLARQYAEKRAIKRPAQANLGISS